MPKTKSGYYAVKQGHAPGVYSTWAECEAQVKGFPGAVHKKFSTFEEAQAFAIPGTNGSASSSASGKRDRLVSTGTSSRGNRGSGIRTSNVASGGTGRSSGSTTVVDFNEIRGTTSSALKRKETGATPAAGEGSVSRGSDATDKRMTTTIVYTDGACSNNGKSNAVAGIGVWWGFGDERNLSERCPGLQTNNRAELIALIRTLETAPLGGEKKSKLIIKTDSKYSINCVQVWAQNWERKGWLRREGEEVKNAGLIQYLLALLSLRSLEGEKVEFIHVYGHRGEEGNEAADHLARQGCFSRMLVDRDWMGEKAKVDERIERRLMSRSETKPPPVLDYLEFQIDPNDLWTEEELEALEKNQEF